MIQTKDKKDILALKDSLTRVRDEIGALKESGEQARQGFVDVALGIKKETTEIKDGLGQVQQGVNQSLFNFDAIGLILSQNIIAGLHEKVSGVVKFIDANQTLSDHKIEGLTGVLTDAVAYIEKVEGLAKDTSVTDTLKAALNDTNKALAQVKNEAHQGTRSIADKQAKASIEIKALTKSVASLADKIAEVSKVAEQKPQIVHVKDADSFSLSNRGVWSPDAEGYKRGSIVRHASASWIALANTTEPPSDKATDWALLARDGRGGGSPVAPATGAVIDDETPALDKTYSSEKIEQLTAHTWTDYVTRAEYVETNGQVLTYTFEGASVFRFVPQNPYVYADDKFFADESLTIELAARV